MCMEVTPEQRNTLLSQKRTANHMFRWVYEVLNSDLITVKQYNVLIKIHDMTVMDQAGYIIHQDSLWPVPLKVKKYQLTASGWKQMQAFSNPGNKLKKYKKDK